MQQHVLYGLGEYPPTDGKCWVPSPDGKTGKWLMADPMAQCTYAPPSAPRVAASGLWTRIPTWVKLLGGGALAVVGYAYYKRRK